MPPRTRAMDACAVRMRRDEERLVVTMRQKTDTTR